MVEVKILFLS